MSPTHPAIVAAVLAPSRVVATPLGEDVRPPKDGPEGNLAERAAARAAG